MFKSKRKEEEAGRLAAMEVNYAIISFEPDGKIIHANDNFLNALGYRLDEVEGQHHRMFCNSSYTSSSEYSQFWRDLANGVSQIDEFERFKKNGESIWIQASYTPVKNKSGKVTRVVKFAQDITDSKKVINVVKQSIDLAKAGNFKQVINQSTQNDGIEELKNGINELFEVVSTKVDSDLNKLGDALRSYQNLDFTHRITGDLGEVARGLNNLAEVVNQMLVENKANGLTLDESSNILLENVDILNQNSNEAAAALEETAAAIEEISSNISHNTDNVVKMSGFAKELNKSANNGQELAQQTTVAMDEINTQVTSINEAIIVIDQIAFQTNILSLNAAVEAATAGEAGKGFAVVAAEVRNLAARSAEAAKEIKDIVETATLKASEGKSIADKMIHGYGGLNENISKTLDLIKDVEMASKEQQTGIVQINDAINSLDKQTQKNASIASQTHSVAVRTDEIAKLVVTEANEKKFIGKDSVRAKNVVSSNTNHAPRSQAPQRRETPRSVPQSSTPAPRAIPASHSSSNDEWESF